MEAVVLTVPERIDGVSAQNVKAEMEVKAGDDTYDDDIEVLLAQAKAVGNPKVIVRECVVDSQSEKETTIDSMPLRSTLVNEKLHGAKKVYAYVITCGRELHDWAKQYETDPLLEFISSSIMKAALPKGFAVLNKWIKEEAKIEKFSALNPGSLPSWPVTGQRQVFGLLAGSENGYEIRKVYEKIQVELTESSLMVPLKSVSGLIFETEKEWHNCSRCKKKDCPNRRAPMDEETAEEMIAEAGRVDMIMI